MKYKVNIVKSAEDDLLEIYKYIFFNDCEENADKIYSKLVEKISSLQKFPNRGHRLPELNLLGVEDFLEINYKAYRIIYRLINKVVFVQGVLDGRRDLQKLLQERLIRE
ncbi:MAG: type II toxin-antitoxin system RelE/ParE family toxin [Bacteroidetes bacterium]|nr:type II toxin-antitoxin system RelE/ParE family toxin [Bacteroidota bacterium]MCH8171155.1 type II toxin-antitoxin system RelE/ParE family toxin [Bacteroidota bacterium]MCH8326605.1 type II toxin-antitoxin system RelE/ParE family toxin [Bacteroidota bacterium]